MPDITIPEEAHKRAWDAVVEVRDACPRHSRDADSHEVVVAALRAGAPVILAAELERQAEQFDQLHYFRVADLLRERADELLGGPARLRGGGS